MVKRPNSPLAKLLLLAVAVVVALAAAVASSRAALAEETLSARVDRHQLELGQTLTLELSARGTDEQPDLSPLASDFEVLRSSRSSQLSLVDGEMDQQVIWLYSLSPLRSGDLQIPPLGAGAARSAPIEIRVDEPPEASDGHEHRDVFLEVDVAPTDPWVQAQAIYRLRLFHARSMVDGSLSGPQAEGLDVHALGEDLRYEERRGGRRYAVLERRYALFPQRSGRIAITPPALTARLRAGSGGGLLGSQRTVRLHGERLGLDVRPRPEAFSGRWWLPAKQLTLRAQWSGDVGQARVGEPITRSLRLQAIGLAAAQLPELAVPAGEGFRVYPDRAELDDQLAGEDGLRGTRVEKWAIVPTRAGTLSLPAIELPWWNTETGGEELLSLPETQIEVLPAASAAAPKDAASGDAAGVADNGDPGTAVDVAAGAATSGSESTAEGSPPDAGTPIWLLALPGWLLAAAFALLWWRQRRIAAGRGLPARSLLFALRWRRRRRRRGGKRQRRRRAASKRLALACAGDDPRAVELALLDWGEVYFATAIAAAEASPEARPRSLLALSARLAAGPVDERHREAIVDTLRRLDAVRYGGATDTGLWRDLPRLLAALKKGSRATDDAAAQALPQL